jgi:hypothetical protein
VAKKKNTSESFEIEDVCLSSDCETCECATNEEEIVSCDLETVVEEIATEVVAPVVELPIVSVEIKQPVLPVMPITEIARKYRQYKKYHDETILAFCKSTGLADFGTEPEMKEVLAKFGW